MKNTFLTTCATGVAAVLLGGCASAPPGPAAQSWAALGEGMPWEHQTFPGKAPTDFAVVQQEGRPALRAKASSSASMMRSKLRVEPADLGRMRFSWKVPQLIPQADFAVREADDGPVRVVLVFEGDRRKFSPRDAMLAELVHAVTGEEMPYATLMYVWCNRREAGEVVHNPRTSRIRKLVVESGSGNLNRWRDYERDIRADFEKAFGEAPGALVGVGVMTDSDNTRSDVQAWYGPLRLLRDAPGRPATPGSGNPF